MTFYGNLNDLILTKDRNTFQDQKISLWWLSGRSPLALSITEDEINLQLNKMRMALVNRGNSASWKCSLHVARMKLSKLTDFEYAVLPQPLYSSDISPTDYQVFKPKYILVKRRCRNYTQKCLDVQNFKVLT